MTDVRENVTRLLALCDQETCDSVDALHEWVAIARTVPFSTQFTTERLQTFFCSCLLLCYKNNNTTLVDAIMDLWTVLVGTPSPYQQLAFNQSFFAAKNTKVDAIQVLVWVLARSKRHQLGEFILASMQGDSNFHIQQAVYTVLCEHQVFLPIDLDMCRQWQTMALAKDYKNVSVKWALDQFIASQEQTTTFNIPLDQQLPKWVLYTETKNNTLSTYDMLQCLHELYDGFMTKSVHALLKGLLDQVANTRKAAQALADENPKKVKELRQILEQRRQDASQIPGDEGEVLRHIWNVLSFLDSTPIDTVVEQYANEMSMPCLMPSRTSTPQAVLLRIFRVLGPVNSVRDDELVPNDLCSYFGGCRMLTCICREKLIDDTEYVLDSALERAAPDEPFFLYLCRAPWFKHQCDCCQKYIVAPWAAFRLPHQQGAWEGCYCSEKCVLSDKNFWGDQLKEISAAQKALIQYNAELLRKRQLYHRAYMLCSADYDENYYTEQHLPLLPGLLVQEQVLSFELEPEQKMLFESLDAQDVAAKTLAQKPKKAKTKHESSVNTSSIILEPNDLEENDSDDEDFFNYLLQPPEQ